MPPTIPLIHLVTWAAMRCEFTYEMSPQLMRRITWRILVRRYRLFFVASFAFLLAAGEGYLRGDSGSSPYLLCVAGYIPLIFLVQYFRAVRILARNPDRLVTVQFDPETISFQTEQVSTTIKWVRFKRLWNCPEALVLFGYHPAVFWLLPIGPLGEDGRLFVEDQIRSHGGKVI